MLNRCLDLYDKTHDICITFANTGCEHEETLRFVDAVDKNFASGRVVWIEAEFHKLGKGPTAKIVDFESASRNGEPFEAAIKKHGIFCTTHPQCTSRLKEEPMISYRRAIGWSKGSYDVAIGIRADEADRRSAMATQRRFIYPLIREGWTKDSVNRFMAQFDWDLKLPSDAYGNCVWCWKKSKRKLYTLANESPDVFDFPARMERDYPESGRVFFRENTPTEQLIENAKNASFRPYRDTIDPHEPRLFEHWEIQGYEDEWDRQSSCGETCEVGAD